MVRKLFGIVLFGMLLLLGSCSSSPSVEQVSQNKKELIGELNHLCADGFITEQVLTDAVDNIVSFEQRGFVGQYWWVIVFLFLSVMLICVIVVLADPNEKELARPIKKAKAYRVVSLVGFLGGHNIYLKKCSWIAVCTILLTIVFFFWNYKYVMYFYDLPCIFFIPNISCVYLEEMGTFYCWELILGTLFILNILTGLILTPFWVYQFNGNYFRKHQENDAILNGKSLRVDSFYNHELIPDIKRVNEDAKTVSEVLKDENSIIEEEGDEKISGFFKNIFTLGKSSKLKSKVQRLRALHWCCQLLRDDLDTLDNDNEELYMYLGYYRVAAYRNLYLAKELIRVVKDNVSSKQQQLIVDEFPNIERPDRVVSGNMHFDSSQISFDSEKLFETLSISLANSFEPINKKLEKEKEICKQDLWTAGFNFAFDGIIAGIEGILDQYQNVSASLREVESQINEAIDYLGQALPAIINYQAEMSRQSEIMIALSQFNKAFIMAYEPMRQKVFGRPTFKQFLYGINKDLEYFKSVEFRKDIQHLILVCSEYNKVYNTKTGMDGNKREKTSSCPSSVDSQPKQTEEVTVVNRETVLATIRKTLKNDHIIEGNSLNFLDLDKGGALMERLCKELSTMVGAKISSSDVSKCKNIREIIDLVIRYRSSGVRLHFYLSLEKV